MDVGRRTAPAGPAEVYFFSPDGESTLQALRGLRYDKKKFTAESPVFIYMYITV